MAYKTMIKLIENANAQLMGGSWTEEEYYAYRDTQQNKLDVFYANGRLTQQQYEELTNMWLTPNEDDN